MPTKIPIFQGNEKIPFWREATKPPTEPCAEKNCNNCERGAVSNKAVFVKYCPDFKVFSRNHERNIKILFLSNVLRGWRFQ